MRRWRIVTFNAAELVKRAGGKIKVEDRTVCLPAKGIFAVIDGIGGCADGEEAARILAVCLEALPNDQTCNENTLLQVLFQAHCAMTWEAGLREGDLTVSCVGTVLWIDADSGNYVIAHFGDTRGYRLCGNIIGKLTMDHDRLSEFTSDEDKMTHVNRNLVRNACGYKGDTEEEYRQRLEFLSGQLEINEIILLVTDGVGDYVTMVDIQDVVMSFQHDGGADRVVKKLFEAAYAAQKARFRYGGDHIGIVYAKRLS